jgi:hypothetical protein
MVGGDGPPPEGTVNRFGLWAGSCAVSNLDPATTGTVTLKRVVPGRVEGNFSITLEANFPEHFHWADRPYRSASRECSVGRLLGRRLGRLTSAAQCISFVHMRTTLDLNAELLAAARRRAAQTGTTLTSVVEGALAAALAPRSPAERAHRLRWKTHRGRLLPGVDVADRDSLLEVMERGR